MQVIRQAVAGRQAGAGLAQGQAQRQRRRSGRRAMEGDREKRASRGRQMIAEAGRGRGAVFRGRAVGSGTGRGTSMHV